MRHIFRTMVSAAVLAAIWIILPEKEVSNLTERASARNTPDLSPSPETTASIARATRFTFCGGAGMVNCVVDGDTFRLSGDKIRIADIDTPELHPARCPYEQALGEAAKQRLLELLNAGPFDLKPIDRDTDRYGRKLRVVMRDGKSLGDVLVREGLARTWEGRRRGWCD
ncbi:thermonuclease family protein [Rhizobium sp. C4]|uniref:thermonuclease family protein n=1 Tax=Rhizobium sp. C4 TaxID=1349800 RepID=UPI003FA7051A